MMVPPPSINPFNIIINNTPNVELTTLLLLLLSILTMICRTAEMGI